MPKTAVVTGASSGVGQAIAIQLAQQGWNVALVARRPDALQQTAALAGPAGQRMLICPCDISQEQAVAQMAKTILAKFSTVHALVNAAGLNAANRSLEKVDFVTYRHITDVNLTGAFLCVQAFLPGMRAQREGTIVNIVSDAGLRANAKAGVAYVVSKFGMAGLTQSINAEERGNGIRACAIFPGDINTPLLDKRPVPPSAETRALMLQADDVAACALLAINLPPRAIIEELLIRPR